MRRLIAVFLIPCALGGGIVEARHHKKTDDTSDDAANTTAPAASPANTTPPAVPAPVYVPVPVAVPVHDPSIAIIAEPSSTAAVVVNAAGGVVVVEEAECVLPPLMSAVDPIRAGITPGALAELTPPELDIVGASLQVNEDGAALSTVVAPAAIGTKKYIPVISDLRLGFYGRQNFQRLGGTLLVGWDSASGKLYNEKADRTVGPCNLTRERALLQARYDRAYRKRFLVGVRGGAELLPVLSGPQVLDPVSMAYVDAEPNRFGGYSAIAHIAYFQDRRFGFYATGGIAGSRAIHGVRGVNMRGGGGVDLAWQIALGQLRSDGFQPGITLGAFGRFAGCMASGGCDEDVHGYPSAVAWDFALSSGAYVDFRLSSLLQLRLAVPTNYYALHSAPAGTSGGANIVDVQPTISLHIASWGL